MAFDRPAPDLQKLITAWEQFEVGEESPGRVLANLKTAGLPEVLRQLADEGWTPTRVTAAAAELRRAAARRRPGHPPPDGLDAGRAGRPGRAPAGGDGRRHRAGAGRRDARPARSPRRSPTPGRRPCSSPSPTASRAPRCCSPGARSCLRTHKGEISFPGGRLDPGETPAEAALREAHEEVGLDPADVDAVRRARPPRHRRQPQPHRPRRRRACRAVLPAGAGEPGGRAGLLAAARRARPARHLPLRALGPQPDRPPPALLRARRRDRLGRHRVHARRPPDPDRRRRAARDA